MQNLGIRPKYTRSTPSRPSWLLSLYTLYWSFDTAEQTITFTVKARTNGWVGFGISKSPNGWYIVNSDVVIGWVNDEGQAFLDVRIII